MFGHLWLGNRAEQSGTVPMLACVNEGFATQFTANMLSKPL